MARKRVEPSGVTTQQLAFIQEYIQLRMVNASEAARRAGTPVGRARQQAHEWLKDPLVKAELKRYQEERDQFVVANSVDVMEELLMVGRASLEEVVERDHNGAAKLRDDIPEHAWRAIKSISSKTTRRETEFGTDEQVEVNVQMHDKPNALKLYGMQKGMFVTKVDASVKMSLVDVIAGALADPND